jgi:dCTP deaminase
MILSDRDIKIALKDKRVIINPSPDFDTQLGACSIDLRLGDTFRVFEHSRIPYIDPKKTILSTNLMKEIVIAKGESFILQPGEFVLASTIEHLTLPDDLLARLEGRSSLGRIGIVVHSTASVFEPGWRGVIVMELGNLGRMPVALYPGMRVCALTFEELSSPALVPYYKKKSAKYAGQTSPVASKIGEEQ